MLRMMKFAIIGSMSLALMGCSDRLIRSVVVHDGHVDQSAITVPAGTPFTLTASAIDSPSVSLSASEIGLSPVSVPNTNAPTLRPGQSLSSADIRKVRIDVGAVPPGTYRILVETDDTIKSVPLISK
ncbi:cupredoxin domain-containing protein [Magnetospirillum molischianum]|uniref:Lipoprotein n=1 Tax=Magnetospirillum molischianum DSM 120 TaxID=1150626 RepID=H8FPZ7_MAGML|nr:hypothetical protein [Magnetospirillum molischianum]CCG40435.1 exported hypothetical protein [Magnetospirillum molischianum DSM 120]